MFGLKKQIKKWVRLNKPKNKKAELPCVTVTKSHSAVRLSWVSGSVTFCRYLTVGLALFLLQENKEDHKSTNMST
jgi:hypothetical protein